jgi:hypothetical protein
MSDWVVAERLLVRRGDVIGRSYEHTTAKQKLPILKLEIPEWDKDVNAFRLAFEEKEKGKKAIYKGTSMIMLPEHQRPAVVVDFEGSRGFEETAYEALILDSNGMLIVRHSAEDTELKERKARYDHWKKHVEKYRQPPPK